MLEGCSRVCRGYAKGTGPCGPAPSVGSLAELVLGLVGQLGRLVLGFLGLVLDGFLGVVGLVVGGVGGFLGLVLGLVGQLGELVLGFLSLFLGRVDDLLEAFFSLLLQIFQTQGVLLGVVPFRQSERIQPTLSVVSPGGLR